MKQEEIVYEIRQMCGQTILMPSLGWHFKYNGQVYFYVVGKDESMIRFCIPFVVGLPQFGIKKRLVACEDRYASSLPMPSDMGCI